MGTQSNAELGKDKKNMIFVIILALAIIISILFWKTESASEKLETAQVKLFGLRSEVDSKIVELDSLHAENKLITSQYEALKKNYMKLQRIIVEKKKNINSIANAKDRKAMAEMLDELNGHLLNYEAISDDLNNSTQVAVNDPNNAQILAENKRIAEELRIAELNSNVLKKEKDLLNKQIQSLQAQLEGFSTTSSTNTAYLEKLQNDFKAEQAKFDALKQETDKLIENKDKKIETLSENAKQVKEIAESSFKAFYFYKEGRKTQRTVLLNTSDLHKSKDIKNILVDFVLPEADENEKNAYLSVFRKEDSGFQSYRFSQMSVPINKMKGKVNLEIEPKLDKGDYKFVVNYKQQVIFNHEFTIK